MFANGPGRPGFNPIPKTQKMGLDAALLNTQHYKVCIKDKMEQSWEWSSALQRTCSFSKRDNYCLSKGLTEYRGEIETAQATALLKSARILNSVLENWKICFFEKPPIKLLLV